MTKAINVASYLTNQVQDTTAMQLQKLLYYSQGCYLALHGQPLFEESIEAWENGPVVRKVFERHRGKRKIPAWWGKSASRVPDEDAFPYETRQILNMVAETLGKLDPDDLVDSTHQESPWRMAREGIPDHAPSRRAIKLEDMQTYFEKICLPQDVEPTQEELSPAAFSLCMEFAHQRAFTPPVVKAEHAEEWFAMLDAPPRDLPGLRAMLTEGRGRSEA